MVNYSSQEVIRNLSCIMLSNKQRAIIQKKVYFARATFCIKSPSDISITEKKTVKN